MGQNTEEIRRLKRIDSESSKRRILELEAIDQLTANLTQAQSDIVTLQNAPSPSGGTILVISETILSAAILTGWDTPIEILAAPGANKMYNINTIVFKQSRNTTRYDVAQDGITIFEKNASLGFTIFTNSSFLSEALDDSVYNKPNLNQPFTSSDDYINQPIILRLGSSANPITGDDDLKYYIEYSIVDFS